MRTIALAILAISAAFGQPADGPAFEVASIKPNTSGSGRVMISRPDSGRLSTENTPLRMLIIFAYNIRDTQLSGGPGWVESERWDIAAKPEVPVPPGPEGGEVFRAMMRKLLAERFQLVLRKESKEMPVYALIPGKNGPKLKESPPESQGPMMRMGMGMLEARKVPVALLARSLSDQLGRIVTDETGLAGNYDFKLEFAPDANNPMMKLMPPGAGGDHEPPPVDAEKPTLLAAVQEQLGLRLESKKEPVDTYVIEKAERPGEN